MPKTRSRKSAARDVDEDSASFGSAADLAPVSTAPANVMLSQDQLSAMFAMLARTQAEANMQVLERVDRLIASSTPQNCERPTPTPSPTHAQTPTPTPTATYSASVIATLPPNFTGCTSRFNGSSRDADNLEAFIDAIEIYKECVGMREDHALRGLPLLLEGQAAVWYVGVKNTTVSWADALEKLRCAFGQRRPAYQIYKKLFSREQGEDERADVFVANARALLAKIPDGELSEKVQLDMVFGLLHRNLRKRMQRSSFETFERLLEKARAIEESRGELEHNLKKEPSVFSRHNNSNSMVTPYSSAPNSKTTATRNHNDTQQSSGSFGNSRAWQQRDNKLARYSSPAPVVRYPTTEGAETQSLRSHPQKLHSAPRSAERSVERTAHSPGRSVKFCAIETSMSRHPFAPNSCSVMAVENCLRSPTITDSLIQTRENSSRACNSRARRRRRAAEARAAGAAPCNTAHAPRGVEACSAAAAGAAPIDIPRVGPYAEQYVLLTTALFMMKYAKGSDLECQMTELPVSDDVCVASLQCDQVISDTLTSWDCIKTVKDELDSNYYYNYGRRRYNQQVTYATNYILDVYVKNADDEHDIFESVPDKIKNIRILQINDGYILTLPEKVYQLSQATEIEISNNQLAAVDLNPFVALAQLTKINFRNNSISTLEMETQADCIPSRSINTIDLSQNVLEAIPNTCFSLFIQLQHLNLSHNMIRSFDILTFEGVLELRTLDVSNNMLFEIGNSFTRFMNLQELFLQNNQLTKISDYNLSTLLHLQKLNLSSNIIEQFENNSFKNSKFLEYLDISNNKINVIQKSLFENSDLHSLFISNNRIEHIEDKAFDGKNISEFNVKGNRLTGSIEQYTFKGIHVTELDLSNGTITSIGNETFKYMCTNLNSLNVSFNKINSISPSAFSCLEALTILDLSHNGLENLNFETTDLRNLSFLYLRNNCVTKITKSIFNNLTALEVLDLSHNEIGEIELQSFAGLKNVNSLMVAHNPFVNTLESNVLDGLVALESVDMSFTRTTSYQNGSFSGLTALKLINSSFGQLTNIDYNAFIKTGSIEKLDVSHNLIGIFCINTTSIPKIQEIYLNDNAIMHITNDTFSGLKLLRMLNLVNNNIQKMEDYALKNLESLSHLYLSSNSHMEIIGNSFENLTNLYQVNLDNVKKRFTFQNATVQIENLDLHSCGIRDINKLFIYKVVRLHELDLSANELFTIDKFSFQTMPFLTTLDLSSNRISFIQPGSFLHVSGLRKLTLFGNNLQTLQFGVFDGIKALHFVNLSNNALQSFDVKLLPVALIIALDNNDISSLSFEDFFESQINKLSIGGNPISCKILAELKTSKYSQKYEEVITTAELDFHSENVDGISCLSFKDKGIISPVANKTDYDIRPMFVQFTNAIENLRSSIEIMRNNTSDLISGQIKSDATKIVNSIQALVDISNQTQIKTGDYLKKIEIITNTSQNHLEDLKEQFINLTNKTNDFRVNNKEPYSKSERNDDDIRSEMKIMLKEEIDAIRDEFGKTFQNFQKHDPIQPQAQVVEKDSKVDSVLYFIAACLGIIIVLYSINLGYGYFMRAKRLNSLHSSIRPIASEMEME